MNRVLLNDYLNNAIIYTEKNIDYHMEHHTVFTKMVNDALTKTLINVIIDLRQMRKIHNIYDFIEMSEMFDDIRLSLIIGRGDLLIEGNWKHNNSKAFVYNNYVLYNNEAAEIWKNI